MNKKGFTLVEVLVSLALVSTIAIFLFQIIFIIRDIYAEKNIKSEIYIESSNVSNVINKDIFNKDKDGIYIKNINKVSNDELYITYSDGTKNNIVIDRSNNTITYGNYTASILDVAKIGNIEMYYNYETTELNKNGICYIKIPITHDDYKNDFGIVITYRYNSSKTKINGEITIVPGGEEEQPQMVMCYNALNTEWIYNYTGNVQEFNMPEGCLGTYKLEVWGAQGASSGGGGGGGGYSSGEISLNGEETLYLVVGGAGGVTGGGYNGGGSGSGACNSGGDYKNGGGGGGATHIAINENLGILKNYVDAKDNVLLVAGGGGGGAYIAGGLGGGAGGGTSGINGTGRSISVAGATQDAGYAFGQGQNGGACIGNSWGESGRGGGGGGWYGGRASTTGANGIAGGGGGSGHVGNVENGSTIAGNAAMPTHDGTSTMTGNGGNGYIKITYITAGENVMISIPETFEYTGNIQTFTAPATGTYKLEVWGAQGGSCCYGGTGGAGGYASGNISLSKDEIVYVNVGGQGANTCPCNSNGCEAYSAGGNQTYMAKTNTTYAATTEDNLYLSSTGGGGASCYRRWDDSGNFVGWNTNGGVGNGSIGIVTDGETIAGNALMPTYVGTTTMTGNTGNGYAKITLVSF